jgi:hypothetical protein
MRRKRLRFDRFMVTLFTCHAGEERIIPPGELTRGILETDAISDQLAESKNYRPLNAITIFTKGSFEAFRGDDIPFPIKAGEGGYRIAYAERWDNLRLRAVEDDSEYHCLFPLDRTAQYWRRKPVSCVAGEEIELSKDQLLYVAAGVVEIGGQTLTGPTMVESSKDQTAKAIERVIGVKIWI